MGDISTASLFLLAVFILLSAFFSGSEAALLSVQRIRLQHMVSSGTPGAKRVAQLIERPDRLLPPILLGNNLVNTAVAAIATTIAISLTTDTNLAVSAATAITTAVLLVFGETIPKTLAAQHAETFSIIVAWPIRLLQLALLPISIVLQGMSSAIAWIFGQGLDRAVITEEEIKAMVRIGREAGAVDQREADMIRRVLEFGDRYVREVMTPRPEIIWVEGGTTVKEFLELYNQNYHTRFPVYHGNVDNVVGLVSVKDVMRMLAKGAGMDDSVTAYVRPVIFVPETKRVQDLFDEMRNSGAQLAMIADEFGGVAGLITLKRLVEGIVGRSAEEDLEEPEAEIIHMGDNAFEIDAGLSITDANERLGLDLPPGEYETVAGFLLEKLGKVPEEGETIEHDGLRFTVIEMRGVRISRVRVTRELRPEVQEQREE